MDNEIKKLQSKIIDLKDAIGNQETHAAYIKTLIENVLNEYFINTKPSELDIKKIQNGYTEIQHFLEIAHNYAFEIRKGVEELGLL